MAEQREQGLLEFGELSAIPGVEGGQFPRAEVFVEGDGSGGTTAGIARNSSLIAFA
ncbi:hypothetical protein ACFWR9_33960 [Streptomyces sp. NPDC058534]|uniref:hypothetical protein n=1 Tax=Streptomyces sp. NPDC058534 TaxID=3346541 RepID=UPI003651D9BB